MQDTKKVKKITTYQLALIGLMTALLCILGPLSVVFPFTPIPVSLTNAVVLLTVWILGWKLGTISYLIYLLLGLLGLPVFSGFTSGPGKLLGPTGGYLIGFLFMAVISGMCIQRWKGQGVQGYVLRFLGMTAGAAAANLLGTVWLSKVAGMSFLGALTAGVVPFIPGDLIKIFLVLLLAPRIEIRLKKAGLLF